MVLNYLSMGFSVFFNLLIIQGTLIKPSSEPSPVPNVGDMEISECTPISAPSLFGQER